MEEELVNNQTEDVVVEQPTADESAPIEADVEQGLDAGTEDGTEVYENEKDYLGKYEFARDVETLDDAMGRADQVWREYQTLKQQVLSQQQQPRPEPPKPMDEVAKQYLARNVYSEQVEAAIKSGRVRAEDQGGLRQLASMYDQANNSVIDRVEDGLRFLAQRVQQQEKILRDQSWTLSPREVKEIGRTNLDPVMDTYGLDDYRKAANIYVALNDPEALQRLTTAARKSGADQARGKVLKRFSSAPRSKPVSTVAGPNFKPYLTPDGLLDEKKLARLTTDKAYEIAEAYEKHLVNR